MHSLPLFRFGLPSLTIDFPSTPVYSQCLSQQVNHATFTPSSEQKVGSLLLSFDVPATEVPNKKCDKVAQISRRNHWIFIQGFSGSTACTPKYNSETYRAHKHYSPEPCQKFKGKIFSGKHFLWIGHDREQACLDNSGNQWLCLETAL